MARRRSKETPFGEVALPSMEQAEQLAGAKPSFYGPIQNPEDFQKFMQQELMKTKSQAQTTIAGPKVNDALLMRLTAEQLKKRKEEALRAGAVPEMGRPRLF